MLYSPTPTPTPAMYVMTPPQPPPHFPCPGYLFPATIPVTHTYPFTQSGLLCTTFPQHYQAYRFETLSPWILGTKLACLKALCNLYMGRQYRRAGLLTFVPCSRSGCRVLPLFYSSLTLLSPLASAVPLLAHIRGCTTSGVFKDIWT